MGGRAGAEERDLRCAAVLAESHAQRKLAPLAHSRPAGRDAVLPDPTAGRRPGRVAGTATLGTAPGRRRSRRRGGEASRPAVRGPRVHADVGRCARALATAT